MTLKQIASTIRNNVVDGLNGATTTSFSMEQLKDEILLQAAASTVKLAMEGLFDISKLAQRIDGIKVDYQDLSANCAVPSYTRARHFKIPNVNRVLENPVLFLGTIDAKLSFKVYFDRDYRFHRHRIATARKPFAWISSTSDADGMHDVFLFNLGKYNSLEFISIDAIFDNPYDLLNTPYYEQFSSSEFYAPLYLQKEIIDRLTQQYVNYYRQMHLNKQPNTQK